MTFVRPLRRATAVLLLAACASSAPALAQSATPLKSDYHVFDMSGAAGDSRFFTASLPTGSTSLRVTLRAGGNAHLRVRRDNAAGAILCTAQAGLDAQACHFDAPQPGVYFIEMLATNAYADAMIVASWQPAFAPFEVTSGAVQLASRDNPAACLQSPMAAPGAGAEAVVAQRECTPVGNAQGWTFQALGAGEYRVVNHRSGGCLDIEGASHASGARLLDVACNGGASQRWQVLGSASWWIDLDAAERAVVRNAMSGRCLGLSSGVAVQVSCTPETGAAPTWRLADPDERSRGQALDGTRLSNAKGGLCAAHDGTRGFLVECTSWSDSQTRFLFAPDLEDALGSFSLRDPEDHTQCMALDTGNDGRRYASVRTCDEAAGERWMLEPAGTEWQLRNVRHGECLAPEDGSAALQSVLVGTTCTPDAVHARWRMVLN